MDIFVEYIEGEFAVCRLPDKNRNIIRLPLKELPSKLKEFQVVTMRENGSFYINEHAREIRMKKISNYLKYKKYCFNFNLENS